MNDIHTKNIKSKNIYTKKLQITLYIQVKIMRIIKYSHEKIKSLK